MGPRFATLASSCPRRHTCWSCEAGCTWPTRCAARCPSPPRRRSSSSSKTTRRHAQAHPHPTHPTLSPRLTPASRPHPDGRAGGHGRPLAPAAASAASAASKPSATTGRADRVPYLLERPSARPLTPSRREHGLERRGASHRVRLSLSLTLSPSLSLSLSLTRSLTLTLAMALTLTLTQASHRVYQVLHVPGLPRQPDAPRAE